MKKIHFKLKFVFVAVVSSFLLTFNVYPQVPLATTDIMLQGFFWDSHGTTKWNQLNSQADQIATYFDMIWLPPASAGEGGGSSNMGYHPYQLANLASSWGSKTELQTLINSLHAGDCKVIADIVINHRAGSTACTFPSETFGNYGTHQFLTSHICKDDEGACTGKSLNNDYRYDWSEGLSGQYGAARDLDHTLSAVRTHLKAYLNWMKNDIGFDGWRYDLVKGYDPVYTKEYNEATTPYLSVGEYYDGEYNRLKGWVDATGKKSTVFDFAFKFAVRDWGGGTDYSKLTWKDGSTDRPAGLIHSPDMRQYAVTFIDNHDTAEPHEHWENNQYRGDVAKANAFMLSSAGIPCVFWKHWVSNKEDITNMIIARKAVGIHSNSDVTVTNKSGYYESKAIGKRGELICRIGGNLDNVPSGFTKACSGNGWVYFTKLTGSPWEVIPPLNETSEPMGNVTIMIKVPGTWSTVKIWAWNLNNESENYTGGTWPGTNMTQAGNGYYTMSFTNIQASEMGVVISNGAKEQTVDLSTKATVCWKTTDSYVEGTTTKYNTVIDNDCGLVSVGDSPAAGAFTIYPNPVDDMLNIVAEKEIISAEIITVSGALLQSAQEKMISVGGLPKGLYLLKVNFADGETEIQKFIKQ